MASGAGEDLARWVVEQVSDRLAEAVEGMAAERPTITCEPGNAIGAGDVLWWGQPLSTDPRARLYAGAPRDAWLALGNRMLAAAGLDPSDSDARGTYLEVLGQALSGLARNLGARASMEIVCESGQEARTPEGVTELHKLVLTFPDGAAPSLFFGFTAEVLDPLKPPPALPAEPEPAPAGRHYAPTLDVLMDVELPVTVSFGRTQVRVQDVLKLSTGSIVELDRAISEPVEIVVNNCVIARGEVVVVDGNYGVRIGEIVSRVERLRNARTDGLATSIRAPG